MNYHCVSSVSDFVSLIVLELVIFVIAVTKYLTRCDLEGRIYFGLWFESVSCWSRGRPGGRMAPSCGYMSFLTSWLESREWRALALFWLSVSSSCVPSHRTMLTYSIFPSQFPTGTVLTHMPKSTFLREF